MNNTKITCTSDFEKAFNLRFTEKCCGICKYGECECDGDSLEEIIIKMDLMGI